MVTGPAGRALHRGPADGPARWPECRCEACFATRLAPLPPAAVLLARIGLAALGGVTAVVVLLGW